MLALALAAAAPAQAAGVFVIDFEDQPAGMLPNPVVYPDASFAAGPEGFFNFQFVTNDLCPLTGVNCNGTLTVDFTNVGPFFFTTDVSFTVTGDDEAGVTGSVDVFRNGMLLGLADIVTDGDLFSLHTVDLSGFGEIGRLVINSVDPAGFVYDNFRYNILVVDPIPAPAALGLFGLGVLALGARRRG